MNKLKIILLLAPVLLLAQSCSYLTGGSAPVSGGVLKSNDTGENWDAVNKISEESSLLGISAPDIMIDPTDNKVLYLTATGSGLFTSGNQAESWNRILEGADMATVKVNPRNNQEIFAAGRAGGIAKVFRSEDRGQTWVEVFSESRTNSFVSALAIVESSPNIIYIGLSTGEIIKSMNSGTSWNLAGVLRGRIIEIDLFSKSSVSVAALSLSDGLFLSDDGGSSWKDLSDAVRGSYFMDVELVESNANAMYLATDKGLYRTGNLGQAWEKVDLPQNQSSETVTAVTLNQKNNNHVYAVVAQTLYKSTDAGESWQTRALSTNAFVRRLVIDEAEPNIIYAALGTLLR